MSAVQGAFHELLTTIPSLRLEGLFSYTEYEICVKAEYKQDYCEANSPSSTCVSIKTRPKREENVTVPAVDVL